MHHSAFRRAALSAGTALIAAAAIAPATASADSLVFIKAGDIWLSAADGSKLTRVTSDGSTESPYRSPSQADDGTIAASKDQLIVRLRQNGEVINTIDPPALRTSVSTPVDGVPVSVAISPDGTKIAYQYATYNCPVAADCMARTATGITWADRFTLATEFATTFFAHPRWVGNSRLVVGGGYGSHANVVDIAAGSQPAHWFDDGDFIDYPNSSDLSHTSVSRDGSRVIALHGYDSTDDTSMRLIWFKATADPRTAALPPSKPEALCVSSVNRGLADPVWSPNGNDLAFTLPEGLHVARNVPREGGDACEALSSTLIHPGATEPDWGPADVNPQPRTQPVPPTAPGGTPGKPNGSGGPAESGSGSQAGKVDLKGKASPKTVATQGLTLKLSALPANTKVTVKVTIDAKTAKQAGLGRKAKTVGKQSVKTSKSGSASLTVRLDQAAAKKLRRLKKFTLTVSVAGASPTTLTLK